MTNKLKHYAMALMLGMGMMGVSSAAQAEDTAPSHTVGKGELRSVVHDSGVTTFADIGAQSQYIWRGAAQSVNNDFAVQGDVGIELENGVSANIWFSTGVDVGAGSETEYDITIDYSGEAGEIGYSVGYIAYKYTDTTLEFDEVYAGVSMGVASLNAYYNADAKNLYTEFGAGKTVEDMFDASIAVGLNSPDTGSSTTHTTLGLSKDFNNVTASLTIGKQTDLDTEFAVGINASF